jgi:VanZ family protein
VGLEFAQLWIPARSFDLLDIAWTLAGAMTGALLAIPLLLLALQKTRND